MRHERVPNIAFQIRVKDESVEGENPYRWDTLTCEDIFIGKKVILFALPGAFTPTCSTTHLPRYEELYDDFKALGIDEIYCLSVNDAFVMNAWAKSLGIKKVKMLPDGNGDFTRGMGMLVKKDNMGFGMRSWRYSLYVEDGLIVGTFVEPGFGDNVDYDPFEFSDADTMRKALVEFHKEQAAAILGGAGATNIEVVETEEVIKDLEAKRKETSASRK
jgi:peroxiredoxin (alkyl hydroperoxide reductase subunit C)